MSITVDKNGDHGIFVEKSGDWLQSTHVFTDMEFDICIKIL